MPGHRCRSTRPSWGRSRCLRGTRFRSPGPTRSGRWRTGWIWLSRSAGGASRRTRSLSHGSARGRVRGGFGWLALQGVSLGVLARSLTGEREVTHGGDAAQSRREGGDSHFEAHRVGPFAGAVAGDGGRAELAGGLHEVLDDDGTVNR